MKTKLITKVLLVTLSLVLALSVFAACDEEQLAELETYKNKVDNLENNVNDNTVKIETLETKEVVAKLQELADSIKLTADAAATQTALAEAIAALEAADTTNAEAISTALAEVTAALEGALEVSDEEGAAKTIQEALAYVKATAEAAATAAALEEVKAALEAADKTGADAAAKALADAKAALEAAIKTNTDADATVKTALETAIANLEKADDDNTTAANEALANAKTALEAALKANADADAAAKATIEGAIATLDGKVDANATDAAAKLAQAKTDLEAALKTNTDLDAATKLALEESIKTVNENAAALAATVEENKATAESKLEEAKQALEAADTAAADKAAEDLAKAVSDLETADGAIETALNDAVELLQNAINANAEEIAKTNTALTDAKNDLQTKIDAINNAETGILAQAKEALENAVSTLEEADTAAAAQVALDIAGAKSELTAAYTAAIDEAVADLDSDIAEAIALINSNKTLADQAVNNAKTELTTAIDNLKNGDVTANAEAIETLQGAVAALNDTYATDDEAAAAIAAAIAELKDGDVETNKNTIAALDVQYTTLNTLVGGNSAAITELTTKVGDNTSAITELQEAVADLQGTYTNAQIDAAIEDAKTAIESDYNEKFDSVNGKLAGITTTVKEAYETADAALETRIASLESDYATLEATVGTLEADLAAAIAEIGTDIDGVNTSISNITAEIDEIKTTLDRLGVSIDVTVEEFVSGFDLVTKILQGTATVEDFVDDPDLTAEGAMTAEQKYEKYGKYTLSYFSEKVNEVKSKAAWYEVDPTVEANYNAFLATEETVRFYLTRATSVESLEGYFADFDAAYDALPTPAETFELAVSAIENKTNGTFNGVTADPACYATAESIYNNIEEINSDKIPGTEDPNTANDVVLDPALVERYENIKAACTNLASAITYANGNVKPAIEAIDATIIWTDACKEEVTTARNAYYTLTTFFANTTNTDLYDETTYTAELLAGSANVTKLTNAEARVAELTRAFAKVEGFKTNEFFADSQLAQPLYTKLAGITALETAVTEWAVGETGEAGWTALEDENIELMLGEGVFAKIAAAQDYAEAMDAINTEHDAANAFENEIKAMNAKTLVLYTDKAAVEALRVRLNALITAVDGDTANLDAIIPADTVTAFEAVEAQMVKLHTAFVTINGEDGNGGLKASITGTEMSYYNSKDVEQDLADIFKACDDAEIHYEANPAAGDDDDAVADPNPIISYLGDANFDTIVAAAITEYDIWMEKYRALTARIAEVYVELESAMAGEYTLADGNRVIETSEMVVALQTEFGVGNTDIDLVIYVEIGEGYTERRDVNLKDIITNWNTFRGKFMAFAAAAQEAAIAVKTEIDAIAEFDATNLNKYEQIVDTAYKAYTDWADTYLNGDYSEAAIDAVQAIKIYGGNGAVYTFVTSDDYDILVAKKATADTTYAAADEAFTAVAEKLNAVNTWTIYDYAKFTDAKTAYASYVETYYKNEAITANAAAGLFGEVAEKADFDVQNTAFHAKLAEIAAAAEAVKEAINAATETTVDATNLNNYEQIKAAFDAYVAWDDAWLNSEAGYVRANLEAIVAYTLDDSAEVYAFVTLAELDAIQAAYTTATATYDAANDAFADIKADFDALDSWTIYNGPEFTAAFNAYAGYVTTYYKDEAITANAAAGLFGEVAEKADLNADYVAYHETLAALEIKAADAVAQIQGIAGLSALDLDNYAQITAAWAAYEAWVADTAVVAERLGELENIEKTEGGYYVFVTAAQYATVKNANDTAEAQKTASVDAWADVVTAFNAVATDWTNIHNQSKFNAADTAYKGYLTTYYETTDHADIADYNGEIADINAYLVKKGEFETNLGNAQSDKNDIDAVIGTLAISNITVDNASDYVTAVADLKAAIAKYTDDYGCDLNACAICGGISADEQLLIAKAEKVAAYTVLYKAQLDLVVDDAVKTASIEGALIDANFAMASATFDGTNTPDSVYEFAVSSLNDLVASWNTVE